MINILFVSHGSSLCGAERCLLDLINGLDRSKFTPHVVIPHEEHGDGPLISALQATDIRIHKRNILHWIPFSQKYTGRRFHLAVDLLLNIKKNTWAIYHLIKRHRIDVVYTNTVTVLEGALAARMARIPHTWHIHEAIKGNPSLTPPFPSALHTYIVSRLSQSIIVPSKYMIETAYKSRMFRKKATVIYNGVDTKLFHPNKNARENAVQQFGLASNRKLVAIIGSIIPVKGHADFIKAASLLNQRHNIEFLIIGDDPQNRSQQIQELAEQLGLKNNVHFLGFQDSLHSILPGLDLLVLTSKSEAFSRIIIEAMASGIPVVATDCGGPAEAVVDGKTGYLVSVGDHSMIASAIENILLDKTQADSFGAEGRNLAENNFSLNNYISKISLIIENTLELKNRQKSSCPQ